MILTNLLQYDRTICIIICDNKYVKLFVSENHLMSCFSELYTSFYNRYGEFINMTILLLLLLSSFSLFEITAGSA